jgi:hypothetical protein
MAALRKKKKNEKQVLKSIFSSTEAQTQNAKIALTSA